MRAYKSHGPIPPGRKPGHPVSAETRAKQRAAALQQHERRRSRIADLERALSDERLRAALWSRGALPLPEPWRWAIGESAACSVGAYGAAVYYDGRGEPWRWVAYGAARDGESADGPDPDPLVCLRAAEAWIAERGAP